MFYSVLSTPRDTRKQKFSWNVYFETQNYVQIK